LNPHRVPPKRLYAEGSAQKAHQLLLLRVRAPAGVDGGGELLDGSDLADE
jgi:hypothetical protein